MKGSVAVPLDTDQGEGVSRAGARTTRVMLMLLCVIVQCVYQLYTSLVSMVSLSMVSLSGGPEHDGLDGGDGEVCEW